MSAVPLAERLTLADQPPPSRELGAIFGDANDILVAIRSNAEKKATAEQEDALIKLFYEFAKAIKEQYENEKEVSLEDYDDPNDPGYLKHLDDFLTRSANDFGNFIAQITILGIQLSAGEQNTPQRDINELIFELLDKVGIPHPEGQDPITAISEAAKRRLLEIAGITIKAGQTPDQALGDYIQDKEKAVNAVRGQLADAQTALQSANTETAKLNVKISALVAQLEGYKLKDVRNNIQEEEIQLFAKAAGFETTQLKAILETIFKTFGDEQNLTFASLLLATNHTGLKAFLLQDNLPNFGSTEFKLLVNLIVGRLTAANIDSKFVTSLKTNVQKSPLENFYKQFTQSLIKK